MLLPNFWPMFLIKFQKKSKNSKKNENPQKLHFDIFALFLAFSTSSQKNLNFQRYLERVQLLTRKFYDHWFFLLRLHWYWSLLKIQKKNQNLQKKKENKKKGKVEGLGWKLSKTFSYKYHATVKNWRGRKIYSRGRRKIYRHGGRRKFGGSKKTQPKFIYREAAAPPFWEFWVLFSPEPVKAWLSIFPARGEPKKNPPSLLQKQTGENPLVEDPPSFFPFCFLFPHITPPAASSPGHIFPTSQNPFPSLVYLQLEKPAKATTKQNHSPIVLSSSTRQRPAAAPFISGPNTAAASAVLQLPTIWANQQCLRSSAVRRSSRPSSPNSSSQQPLHLPQPSPPTGPPFLSPLARPDKSLAAGGPLVLPPPEADEKKKKLSQPPNPSSAEGK